MEMQFDSDAQKEVYDKVLPWIKELFGIFVRPQEDAPYFGLNIGSAFVHIGILPWGEHDAVIKTRSYVVRKVAASPELMHFLLRENDTMRFGAFGLDEDGDIFFEYSIQGSTCTLDSLKCAVLAVGYTADQYDEKIVEHWGGELTSAQTT
jgi:hypothetical protein